MCYKAFVRRAMPNARPKRLLAEAMPRDEVERIDQRLAALGRGLGALRLWLGEGLATLEANGGVGALGFPTLASYATEALGITGRQAADSRALARRLTKLPALRAALVAGRLAWSKVELVARFATPDDEAEWVARAEQLTVRALRKLIDEANDEISDDEDEPTPKCTLMVTVDRVDAMAFEHARIMVQAVGARGLDGAVEAMLAEGLSEIVATVPDVDLPEGICGLSDAALAWREELLKMRREGDEVCEAQGFDGDPEVAPIEIHEPVFPGDATEIDHVLRDLASELSGRDLELGHLARRSFEANAWQRLGYARFEQYCRERIGLSASSVAARISLARQVARLPVVEEALSAGRIGYCAAGLIARVAGPKTAEAWVERAAERTVKHLREEVEAVELIARAEGREVTRIGPPDEATLEEVHDVERAVIATLTDGFQMSGSDEAPPTPSLAQRLPSHTLRMTVSEETARFWRMLERVHAGIWTGTSFVAFLAGAVGRAWGGAIERARAGGEYADVYLRDRWRCRSPICGGRNVTPHHVRFRSRGGGEERSNLLSLCDKCHLELVHGGTLSVVGDASVGGVLRWEAAGFGVVGRVPFPRAASGGRVAP